MTQINDCKNYDENEESCTKHCDAKHCIAYMPKEKKYNIERVINKISELLIQADRKSAELMIGDFKQYFDEEFSPKMWEIIG